MMNEREVFVFLNTTFQKKKNVLLFFFLMNTQFIKGRDYDIFRVLYLQFR